MLTEGFGIVKKQNKLYLIHIFIFFGGNYSTVSLQGEYLEGIT